MKFYPLRQALVVALTALCAVSAQAHDTWFELRSDASSPALWLGTGARFPILESRLEPEHLQRQGCARHSELLTRGTSAGKPLLPHGGPARRLPQALSLRLPAALADATTAEAHSCWASLVPFEIELEPHKVELYLKEVAAGPAIHAAWAAEKAAGRPWRERYVKHARLEIGSVLAKPLGLPLEAVVLNPLTPQLRDEVRLQLLHEGRPLPNHPVELVSERSPVGLWRRTDAEGQLVLPLPLAGRWLLRSALLRPPAQAGAAWTSDFVTLVFEIDSKGR